MASPTPFGAPMKELFLADPEYRNLNHGSFGTYPKAIQKVLREYQSAAEARPDVFVRYTQPKAIDAAREVVASLLKVPAAECVLVSNATTGVNTVLRNLVFSENDAIIFFETVYGAVERSLVALCEATPLRHIRRVPYTFPVSHEEIVRRFRAVVAGVRAEGLRPRLAIFDTIVSNPGVRFPFEELTRVCREEGLLSLIDGAHGIGQIPLDLGVLQPDFFTSNCHKWLFVPRGCAVLYVPKRNQHLIRTTLPTSWGFIPAPTTASTTDKGTEKENENENENENNKLTPSTMPPTQPKPPFITLFEFVATADNTPYCCIPAAVKFRSEVCGGEDRIYAYLEDLANEAGDILARVLGTDVLQEPGLGGGERGKLRACAMTTVRLPICVSSPTTTTTSAASAASDAPDVSDTSGVSRLDGSKVVSVKSEDVYRLTRWMQSELVERGTFVPIFQHGGWMWTRLSAQVYLEKSDFEWLAGEMKELCGRVEGYLRS